MNIRSKTILFSFGILVSLGVLAAPGDCLRYEDTCNTVCVARDANGNCTKTEKQCIKTCAEYEPAESYDVKKSHDGRKDHLKDKDD